MKYLLLILWSTLIMWVCYGTELNKKFSHKDFTDQDLSSIPAKEFNDTLIKGSCFYQQGEPDQIVFPKDMIGVTFDGCNLDNCFVPEGNIILPNCTHKRLRIQNDKHIWLVDKGWKPIEPFRS